ncbi:amino acid ABC transporter permease [Chelatococcus sp. GCM10030263]|uniref:amino acid ABC transporter permease n=1 Tax=Chelatococcus sp. GCM10030263 TaxID=3273387 RepID=UPI0036094828
MGNLDFSIVWEFRDALAYGLMTSLLLSAICAMAGTVLGFFVALCQQSPVRPLRWVAMLYVEVLRGAPTLITLFWVFFCLPIILGVEINAFWSSIIALTLYMGAITSESFRSSLKSIGQDQYDASNALGLAPTTRTAFIVAPQAVIRAIPNILSNVISLFKESTLVSAVGMVELMYTAQTISNVTARPIEILTAVALIYFVIGYGFSLAVSWVETRVRARTQG